MLNFAGQKNAILSDIGYIRQILRNFGSVDRHCHERVSHYYQFQKCQAQKLAFGVYEKKLREISKIWIQIRV